MQRLLPLTAKQEPIKFVKFVSDLVSYGLHQVLNVRWKSPYHETNGRTFDEMVGMAAVVFRHRHANEFTDNIADCPFYVLEDIETTLEYLQHFILKNFKGRVPLMEFIVYCAFLVDLAVCCFENDKKEFISEIVEETYDLYEDHIKSYFHVIGGWHAINQMAEQYLEFIKSVKLYGALMGEETSDLAGCFGSAYRKDSHASTLSNECHMNDSAEGSDTTVDDSADGSASADSHMDVSQKDQDSQRNISDHSNDSHVSASVFNFHSQLNTIAGRNNLSSNSCEVYDESLMGVMTSSTNDKDMDVITHDFDSHIEHLHVATRNHSNDYLLNGNKPRYSSDNVTVTSNAKDGLINAREIASACVNGYKPTASEIKISPTIRSYSSIVYSRNGLVIPSTSTSEYTTTGYRKNSRF